MATDPAHPGTDAGADPSPRGDIRAARPRISALVFASLIRRFASACALCVLDLAGLTAALYAALTLREAWVGHHPPLWHAISDRALDWLPFLALITVLVFWRAGLYREREVRAGFGRVLSSLTLVAVLAFAFAIGTGFDFHTYGVLPATLVFASILIGLLRAGYESATGSLLRRAGVRRRVLLVGRGDGIEHLQRALGSGRAGIEYELVGTIDASAPGSPLGATSELARRLGEQRVDEVLLADSDFEEPELLDLIEAAHARSVRIRVAPRATELLAERAQYVPGQGMPLFELRPPVLTGADWAVKRLFDVIVSAIVLVVGLPFFLLIAAAIRITSRGPVFYRDSRVGLGEDEFEMLKFRTMEVGAAERRSQLAEANEAGGALFKIRDDPRVTSVGRILRRFSIDELPQVLNVLRGQMSLVGPRPLPSSDYAKLDTWHRRRSLVLPGMTGLWQISGRSELGLADLVNLDFYYIERWSLGLDITILLKTLPAVLSRRGAY